MSKGIPVYAGGLLFTRGDHSLIVRRLLAMPAAKPSRRSSGNFSTFNPYFDPVTGHRECQGNLYSSANKRIVRIDLATLNCRRCRA